MIILSEQSSWLEEGKLLHARWGASLLVRDSNACCYKWNLHLRMVTLITMTNLTLARSMKINHLGPFFVLFYYPHGMFLLPGYWKHQNGSWIIWAGSWSHQYFVRTSICGSYTDPFGFCISNCPSDKYRHLPAENKMSFYPATDPHGFHGLDLMSGGGDSALANLLKRG